MSSFSEQILNIWLNKPHTTVLEGYDRDDYDHDDYIEDTTDENWEQLGRAITDNTHLINVNLSDDTLNDEKMQFFFRGLTRSSSIEQMELYNNRLSAIGMRSMVPFLQNANNLTKLDLSGNNLHSEGFNILLRALRDSRIKILTCRFCGIESIEINSEHIPGHLERLLLSWNSINTDGCRGLAKLLQVADSALTHLALGDNKIDDEGVEILSNALQKNTSLTHLDLMENDGISKQGEIMLLKLVNDISSIEATLQSNHTLMELHVNRIIQGESLVAADEIQRNVDLATKICRESNSNPEAVGKEKIIQTQLNSERRAAMCRVQEQEVDHSVFSEIDPLHLPEVLSLIGRKHGQEELYVALLSSIASLFSSRRKSEFSVVRNRGNDEDAEHTSSKRRRT